MFSGERTAKLDDQIGDLRGQFLRLVEPDRVLDVDDRADV